MAAAAYFCQVLPANAEPPTLSNVRTYQLPAEILLTWESTGADHYNVYSAEADRRWRRIASQLTVPRYRDMDFLSLPGYYQVAAYNASGEVVASEVILVTERQPLVTLGGVTIRPVSGNATRVDCLFGFPDPVNKISFPAPGGAVALLELGTSPTEFTSAAFNGDFAEYQQSFVISDLQPGAIYWYRLTCLGTNGAGVSYVNSFTAEAYVEPPVVTLNADTLGYSDVLTHDEDMPVRFVLTNTADMVDWSMFSYWITRQPEKGAITQDSSGFLFTPNLKHCGEDSFDWALGINGWAFQEGTILISTRPVNDSPIALDASFTGTEDSRTALSLSAFEPNWEPVSYTVVSGPTNGTTWSDPYHFVYIPNPNFSGVDHITFRASDGTAEGNIATIRIRVTPINDPPVAPDVSLTVVENTTTEITLPGSDIDNTFLVYSMATPPSHGACIIEYRAQATYTTKNYVGADSFTYSVSDGSLEAIGTVYITVLPDNHPPTANNLSVATEYGVPVMLSLSGSDPDNNAITFRILTSPTQGTLSGDCPVLLYTPAPGFSGVDSFTYVANDGKVDSLPATVTISVSPETAPPFAPDNLVAVSSDKQVTLTWRDRSSLEKGFRIERAVDGGEFKQITAAGENVCTVTDNGVQPGKIYSYRVVSWNKQGESGFSNIALASPPYPATPW